MDSCPSGITRYNFTSHSAGVRQKPEHYFKIKTRVKRLGKYSKQIGVRTIFSYSIECYDSFDQIQNAKKNVILLNNSSKCFQHVISSGFFAPLFRASRGQNTRFWLYLHLMIQIPVRWGFHRCTWSETKWLTFAERHKGRMCDRSGTS